MKTDIKKYKTKITDPYWFSKKQIEEMIRCYWEKRKPSKVKISKLK